jgi:hypothetical protein
MIHTGLAFLGLVILFAFSLGGGKKSNGGYTPPTPPTPKKTKSAGFGRNSAANTNDRTRHSLNNFTNGD